MFDWLKRTTTKYQKAFWLTGAITTGAVTVGYVCKQKLLSWQQEQLAELLRNTHIDQHYLQHHNNTKATLIGYFETLQLKINDLCDTNLTIKQLKDGSIPKVEGWKLLKHQSFTKLLLTLYSTTLISVFVSIQLTVVSSNIFLSFARSNSSPDVTTKRYLGKVRYILDYALPEIHRVCDAEVARVFADIALDSEINFENLTDLLDNLNISTYLNVRNLCRITLEGPDELKDENLHQILLQTYDILDSDDFKYTCSSCFKHNETYMSNILHASMKQDNIVVARLLPSLTKVPAKLLDTEREQYVTHMVECQQLQMLSRHLYQGLTADS